MDLQPIKLEQPYSVIYQKNKDDDPNKLGSWERPPHNSSKITKENLNDAMAVNNVFKDSIDTGNALQAPEGNNNDYFLKAKNNLVSKTNDRKIGEFLNQFHGMDFFKRGVPEIEKGLKGTGYDMGPSANIVDNLKEAVDKGDTKEVENIIEKHPEESQEVLPENTPIQEEAKQITEDTNKANDEVNNEVVEDFVEDSQTESELFPVGYNTEQVTDPNVGSIPEDLPENNRPLDNFVLKNYDDDKDRGELSPAIESSNDNKAELATENDTDLVGDTPELDNTSLENEAQQIESDTADSLDVDNIEDFEAYAQKAQDEFNKVLAEQKEKAKANKEFRGNKTGISRLPSTGMLGGKHWYEVDPEKLYEYANQLIDDGEGLLGEASGLGRELSRNDAWSTGRSRVGSLATYGNGVRKRGKHLLAVGKYLQERGINPAELKPSTRKALLRTPIPGDKYNRKGKQEDYEYNLDVILKYSEGTGKGEDLDKLMATSSNKDNKAKDNKKKGSIDWDKVHVYKPGEDPYNKVSDVYDWIDNPDYVPTDEPVMSQIHKDEDFAGPDELPATIDQIKDEDFVGPDEQLALYNGGVPAETEPVYDTSDYNFDWDYDIQTLGVKSPEEIPDAPVTNVEQAKAKQRLMKWLKSHGRSYRISEPENDMSSREEIHNNYRSGGRAAGSSLLGNIGRSSGLSYTAPNVHPLNKEDKHGGPSNSTASGSVELPNSEKPTERTMSMSTINSGETMFGKSGMLGRADLNKGGEIKVGQSGIKAGFTGHTTKPEELAPKPFMGSNVSNGIYTDLITQILRKFPNGYADNQITITVNGQNVLVNGKQLSQLSDIELNILKEIL